ncbi:tetratricopeptide repeat protein, partial [Nocardia sp. R16R-3T]
MTVMQGDVAAAAALVEGGRVFAEQDPTPMTQALITYADGVVAMFHGELAQATSCFERAVEVLGSTRRGSLCDPALHASALFLLGVVRALAGDTQGATESQQQLISITEACGESLFRSSALWVLGTAAWRQGEPSRAIGLLQEALRVNRRMSSPIVTA